jgi:hypothetical protein
MKQVLNLKAMGLLFMLLTIGLVKAQSLTPVEPARQGDQAVPHWDAAGYDAQKTQWVNENPDLYNQMLNGKETVQPQVNTAPWGAPENKAAWVAAHPQEYAAMAQKVEDTRQRITRAQFNAYPADKQAAILNDPNFVIIE